MPNYPGSLAFFVQKFDFTDTVFATHINALQDEVVAITATLGTLPAASFTSVKARIVGVETGLAALQATINTILPGTNSLSAMQASINALTASLASEITTRANADVALRANITRLTARASFSNVQSIPFNSWTTLVPNVLEIDNANASGMGFFSNTISTGNVYTLGPVAGTYLLEAQCAFSSNPNGVRGIRWITSTGTVIVEETHAANTTGSDFLHTLTQFEFVNPFDPDIDVLPYPDDTYLNAQVFQNAASSLSINASSPLIPGYISASYTPTMGP